MNPVKIELDIKYEGMYRLVWENKTVSEDCYNLTRANDILKNYDEYRRNMKMWGNKRSYIWNKEA